jgi:adenosylcobinamide-GDP ribazoletransferase
MTPLLLAFSMLTRLPLHPSGEVTPRHLRLSVMFYPWVGALVGVALWLGALGLAQLHIPLLGGVVLTALLALVTGGLHLDGLADWFDAVGGGRGDRQRMLDIMKDSRIGAHGAVALVLVLFAKCAVLDAAIGTLTPTQWIALPALSRLAIVPLVAWMKPARDQGLARSVHGASSTPIVVVAWVPVIALVAGAPLRAGLTALVAALVTSALVGAWAQRRIGGSTGDVYGAALELSELAALAALVLSSTTTP